MRADSSNATATGAARCGSGARTARNSCAGSRSARCATPRGQRSHYVARAHRHHRQEARRAGTALPGQLRHADQPAEPRAAVRAPVARDRARAPAGKRASRCCSSTSTASRTSTIRSATPPATASCSAAAARLQADGGRRSTRSRAWAATSSPSCWRTSTRRRKRRAIAREIITAFDAPLDIDEPPGRRDHAVDRHQPVPRPRARCRPTCSSTPTPRCTRPRPRAAAPTMRYTEAMDTEIAPRARRSPPRCARRSSATSCAWCYQPQLSLPTGAHHRRRGAAALDTARNSARSRRREFIPLAEESGLILRDRRMGAARGLPYAASAGARTGSTDLTMAVNVSALQLLRGDLPAVVCARAATTPACRPSASSWSSPRAW